MGANKEVDGEPRVLWGMVCLSGWWVDGNPTPHRKGLMTERDEAARSRVIRIGACSPLLSV